MGCQVSTDKNVHVVIVGGGFGGIAAAQHLKHHGVPFMLIDILDAFHHNCLYFELLHNHSVIYLHFHPMFQIQEANTVVVVGGGTTGVEMAAEIRTEFTNKNVILIHPREEVADPDLLPSVKEQAKKVLLEKGVELLLGQKVTNLDELELNVCRKGMLVKTNKNEQVTADLVICCTGNKISSEAYRSSLTACMGDSGALKVNKHLQVEGFDSVYAVGDCADLDEPKMAYHAGLHAAVAATNIINSLTGKSLTSYRTGNVTMLIAMGKDAGVGQFNGYKLPQFLVTKGKSQSLLLWKSWREMGQKAPN
uniref:Ferroptosis suppressor protein 1 n=1 Tax=Cyprinus carpio TaxID=7962 RepID=A0A8C2DGA4_CYPCA